MIKHFYYNVYKNGWCHKFSINHGIDFICDYLVSEYVITKEESITIQLSGLELADKVFNGPGGVYTVRKNEISR